MQKLTGILLVISTVTIFVSGCESDESTSDLNSEKSSQIAQVIKEKQPTSLESCLEENGRSENKFEALDVESQDIIRNCIQAKLRAENRLVPRTSVVSSDTTESIELTPLEKWTLQNAREICKAGVSYKNRWGDPGQASPGQYAGKANNEYIFKEFDGTARIRCAIAGKRLLMGWHTRPFDPYKFGDIHYTFEQQDSGVRVIEHAFGEETYRDYPID